MLILPPSSLWFDFFAAWPASSPTVRCGDIGAMPVALGAAAAGCHVPPIARTSDASAATVTRCLRMVWLIMALSSQNGTPFSCAPVAESESKLDMLDTPGALRG